MSEAPTTARLQSTVSVDEPHHVHFDEATIALKDPEDSDPNSITFQRAGDRTIHAHLGFLQIAHRYHIDLRMPAKWLQFADDERPMEFRLEEVSNDGATAAANSEAASNVHCKLLAFHLEDADGTKSAEATNDDVRRQFYNLKIEYFAHAERLLKEELRMVSARDAERDLVRFVISARVLGRGKGTPMLRNGIHCVGSEDGTCGAAGGYDSDASAPGAIGGAAQSPLA